MAAVKNVVFVAEDEKAAQYRYRMQNIVEVLGDSDEWKCHCYSDSEFLLAEVDRIDLIVVIRQTAKNNKILKKICLAQKRGVKVLFDLDDLVFDYTNVLLVKRMTNERNIIYWLGYFWGIRRIAKCVDGFICTNEFLARKLKRSFNKPVKVIRNSLNNKQVEVSEKWVEKKKDREKTENVIGKMKEFSIGYFSGSPTHVKDFRLVENELIRFLKNHDDAVLKVVGYMEFSTEMKKMIEAGRVEVTDVVDYLKLQGLMSKVDVNIAPLVINDFTNCKSELKFFEAGIVETTTIASPTFAFKKAISDGENGFLAKPSEWYTKLEYLYEHPKENKKIAKRAKAYALKHYYGKEFLKEVEEAYGYFAN